MPASSKNNNGGNVEAGGTPKRAKRATVSTASHVTRNDVQVGGEPRVYYKYVLLYLAVANAGPLRRRRASWTKRWRRGLFLHAASFCAHSSRSTPMVGDETGGTDARAPARACGAVPPHIFVVLSRF